MLSKSISMILGLGMAVVASSVGNTAVTGKNVLFILDSSGSMAQRLGDETKMQAAKKTFSDMID